MGYPSTIRSGCILVGNKLDELRSTVPSVTSLSYKGVPLVALPHTDETTLFMRNMGYEVVAPMDSTYSWPGPFTPYTHQRTTAGAMSVYPRLHVFDDPGLGKSAAAIWASDYLLTQGKIKNVLIVVPLSTMRETWDKELLQLVPFRSAALLYGTKKKRQANINKDAEYYIINHHGLKVIEEELIAKKFDLVIFDESTALKNSNTEMWRILNEVATKRLWLMTGTPTPNSPLDAWGQGRLIRPDLLPSSRTRWQQKTMLQVTRFKWVPKVNSAKDVKAALQPCVRHNKDECLDLPPVTYTFRESKLSSKQTAILKDIKNKAVSGFDDGDSVTAVNAAALLTKVLQVSQGAVINDQGGITDVESTDRMNVLLECINQTSRKVIVFVSYTAVLKKVYDELLKKKIGTVMVDGTVSKVARDAAYRSFRESPDIKVLVAHPQTTAHGLTLIEADTTVWYGPTYNAEHYEQANNRMNRPGQHHNMNVVHIYATPFEKAVYSTLQGKLDFQGAVLGAAKEWLAS